MAIKLRYDPKADRMRLAIEAKDQPMRVYWLKRNQCLALLARLQNVANELGIHPPVIEPLKNPPPRLPKISSIDDVMPEDLDAFRVKVNGAEVSILMRQNKEVFGVNLQAEGLKRLQEMIGLQAERAGWDPVVGIQRILAMAQARLAIAKSKPQAK